MNLKAYISSTINLALQHFPSDNHERAWKCKYEPGILHTRTMTFLAARIMQSALFLMLNIETYQLSESYLEEKQQE